MSKQYRLLMLGFELACVGLNLFGPHASPYIAALFAFMAGADFAELLRRENK